jgi:hypothetical protein
VRSVWGSVNSLKHFYRPNTSNYRKSLPLPANALRNSASKPRDSKIPSPAWNILFQHAPIARIDFTAPLATLLCPSQDSAVMIVILEDDIPALREEDLAASPVVTPILHAGAPEATDPAFEPDLESGLGDDLEAWELVRMRVLQDKERRKARG